MNNNLSDFMKHAYNLNKVRNVSEAFKEYPVEEEWHKGKIENVLNDKEVLYNLNYEIGDIVFVKEFIYENNKIGKNHLFIIIDQNKAVTIENFAMLISSKLSKLKYNSNILLKKDKYNNLKKDSIVKTDKLYIIDLNQILYKIGEVSKDKIDLYKRSFLNN